MIAAVQFFLLILSGFFLLCILAGLVRPVLVLWFLDRFNRLKVLVYYGKALGLALFLWLIFWLLGKS